MSRYEIAARFYDRISGERLLYRRGRETLFAHLGLHKGNRVLVVGCGTGLDLPLLVEAVGPEGLVVGVDRSLPMLTQARKKVASHGWENVRLIDCDAAALTDVEPGFDAVVFTYSLSIIENWRHAWDAALKLLVPGGSVGVVDTDLPSGRARVLSPLVVVEMWIGGIDRKRKVWQLVDQAASPVIHDSLAFGHIQIAVGTVNPRSIIENEAH